MLNTGRDSSGAYYLAGYAVECAIKACIAKKTRKSEWPPKPEDVRKMYSHDLNENLNFLPGIMHTASRPADENRLRLYAVVYQNCVAASATRRVTFMSISEPTAEQGAFCSRFLEGVQQALGDNLYSFYLYGAMLFPRPAAWRVDVDFHIIVASPLDESAATRVKELHVQLGSENPLGKELDGYYLLLNDARQTENPRHLVWTDAVDFAWALHRAHIHAGKFKLLHGHSPQGFLPIPNWLECVRGLDSELQFVKDHPQYPQFGVLNLSRLLLSWIRRDVVISKWQAGLWAMTTLDQRWRPAVEAAMRDYEERPHPGDKELLDQTYPEFQTYCEGRIQQLR